MKISQKKEKLETTCYVRSMMCPKEQAQPCYKKDYDERVIKKWCRSEYQYSPKPGLIHFEKH